MTGPDKYTLQSIENSIRAYSVYLDEQLTLSLYDYWQAIERLLGRLFILDGLIARMKHEHAQRFYSIPRELYDERESLGRQLGEIAKKISTSNYHKKARHSEIGAILDKLLHEIKNREQKIFSNRDRYLSDINKQKEIDGENWTAASHEKYDAILWDDNARADMECLFQLHSFIRKNLEPVRKILEQRRTTRQSKSQRVSDGGRPRDTGTQRLLNATVKQGWLSLRELAEQLVSGGLDGGTNQHRGGTIEQRVRREEKRLREVLRVDRSRHQAEVDSLIELLSTRLANDGCVPMADLLTLADERGFCGGTMSQIRKQLGAIAVRETPDGRWIWRIPERTTLARRDSET
jgi:hypothetical protein